MCGEVRCILFLAALTWPFTKQFQVLKSLRKKAFENIAGKEENAGDQYFLLFPQCFVLFLTQMFIFSSAIELKLYMYMSKSVLCGKELTLKQTTKLWTGLNWKHLQTTN